MKSGSKGAVPLSKIYSSDIGGINEEQRKLRISLEREQVQTTLRAIFKRSLRELPHVTKLSKSKEYLNIMEHSRRKAASPSPQNDDFSSLEARPGPRTRPHREESGLNSTKFSFKLEQQRSSEAPRRAVGRFNPLVDDKRLSRESVFMQSISKHSEKGGPSATESPLKEHSLAGGSVCLRDILVQNDKSFPGLQDRGAIVDLGYSFDGSINITSEEFAPRRKIKK